jgi:D-glycero-alpha-D-manno-heptose-7-phosphate kinase
LADQHVRSLERDSDMRRNLDTVKSLAFSSKDALESGDLVRFAELMHEHWENKKRRSGHISNPQIDEWYSLAMRNGAMGGKLVGAGGGGFLMFYTEDRARLRQAMAEQGLDEVRFRFDFEGTKVVLS